MYKDDLQAQCARADAADKRAQRAEEKLGKMKKKDGGIGLGRKMKKWPWYPIIVEIIIILLFGGALFIAWYHDKRMAASHFVSERTQKCREKICDDLCKSEQTVGSHTEIEHKGILECICYYGESRKTFYAVDTCEEKKDGL